MSIARRSLASASPWLPHPARRDGSREPDAVLYPCPGAGRGGAGAAKPVRCRRCPATVMPH